MYQRRRAKTSPRSAANTPNWQVNDDATRMIVKTSRVGDVQFGRRRRPLALGLRPDREVDAEQAGEEHQLAGQPHDHADTDHVRTVQRVDPGLIAEGPGGAGRSRHRWIMDCACRSCRLRVHHSAGRAAAVRHGRAQFRQVARRPMRRSLGRRAGRRSGGVAGHASARASCTHRRREQPRAVGLQPPPGGPGADHHRDRAASGARTSGGSTTSSARPCTR